MNYNFLKSILLIIFAGITGFLIGIISIREKVVYTNYLYLTCMLYNESGKITMACNPIDIEPQPNGKNLTFGFELPGNASYTPYKTIRCKYDLNNKRFIFCYQLNYGVVEENATA